ncbi:phospholipase-like protein [Artemisia annua]|uniref:Phospholipase-like protein n=1 Tax=Artemisia annua TaxID=35608 RepID=A0A2U1NUN4_ARTAN|nr:phospholipase-like protein [Artemisia annua]
MDSSSASTSTVSTSYDAKVTVRSRLDCINQIRGLLNTNRTILFRKTVFGPWLDIPSFTADVHLLNYFYQNEVNAEESEECPFLRFKIGDNVLEFGREQFCLITGFHFGPIAKEEINIGSLVKGLEHSPFYDRLFPEDKTRKNKKIKGEQLKAFMKPGKVWDGLSDEDAVRVCLLVMATCVFIGREGRFYIPDHLLKMIEDFDVWNCYPWGEYMWIHLYKRTVNVVKRHNEALANKPGKNLGKESPSNEVVAKKAGKKPQKESPTKDGEANKDQTYNLYGFVWAVKIWILETFPNSVQFWKKDPTKTPRGLAWSKFNNFDKKHYPILFDPAFKPLDKFVLRNDEMFCQWYTRSMDYIRGLRLQVVVAAPLFPQPVNVVCAEFKDNAKDDNIANEVPDGSVLYAQPDGGVLYGDATSGADKNIPNEVPDRTVLYVDGRGVTGYGAGGCGAYCEGDERHETVKESSEFVNENSVYGDTNLSEDDVLQQMDSDHMQNEVDDIKSSVVSIEERVRDVDVKELYREIENVKRRVQVIEKVLKIENPENSAHDGENKDCPVQSDPVDPEKSDFVMDNPSDLMFDKKNRRFGPC